MEDVCVVESGPSMAKKDAFMIVRHIKFGAKKSGKKFQNAANAKTHEGNMETSTANPSDSVEYESHAESGYETEENPSDADMLSKSSWSAFSSNDPVSPTVYENRYRRNNQGENNAQVPPAVTENRYRRVEPRNRYQQASNSTGSNNYQGPGTRDAFRSSAPPPNWNQPRRAPVNGNVDTGMENNRQGFTPPGSRHSMPSHENIHNHPSNASNNTTPRPGYGNFRGPNHAGAPNTTRPPSYGSFSAPNDGIPKHPSAPNTPKTF